MGDEQLARKEYLQTYFIAESPPSTLAERWGIVTAFNPAGEPTPDASNRKADIKLKECLERSQLAHFRVIGGSRDGKHREPGFAVLVDDPVELDNLARQFGQEAFFWVQDGDVYCVKVGDLKRYRLGAWDERRIHKWLTR